MATRPGWCNIGRHYAASYAPFAELVRCEVGIGACEGVTRRVELEAGRWLTGFVGTVRFTLLKPQELPPQARTALLALARFATFSGTGVETMRGMGQTRHGAR